MTIRKILPAAVCTALLLTACGGSDENEDTGTVAPIPTEPPPSDPAPTDPTPTDPTPTDPTPAEPDGNTPEASPVLHSYFSLGQAEFWKPAEVEIDPDSQGSTLPLGGSSVTYSVHNGALAVTGYTPYNHLAQASQPSGFSDGLALCDPQKINPDTAAPGIAHLVLPAEARKVSDISALNGKTFLLYQGCDAATNETFRFDEAGGLNVSEPLGTSTFTAAEVANLFSESGLSWSDEEEEGTVHGHLYAITLSGREVYFAVIGDEYRDLPADGSPSTKLLSIVLQESRAVQR